MKAILGRKLGMTQMFDEAGNARPVTLIAALPCAVTALRTSERDGYTALQLGSGTAKRLTKALTGHFKASGAQPAFVREFRGESEVKVGDQLDVTQFTPGDKVQVSGTSKGKGFAGTIKRHNFSRGPMTHGSNSRRRPGSIGSMYPQKIFKGKRMAGRMGNERVSVRNLEITVVDAEKNLLAIGGAVPGRRGAMIEIRGAE